MSSVIWKTKTMAIRRVFRRAKARRHPIINILRPSRSIVMEPIKLPKSPQNEARKLAKAAWLFENPMFWRRKVPKKEAAVIPEKLTVAFKSKQINKALPHSLKTKLQLKCNVLITYLHKLLVVTWTLSWSASELSSFSYCWSMTEAVVLGLNPWIQARASFVWPFLRDSTGDSGR